MTQATIERYTAHLEKVQYRELMGHRLATWMDGPMDAPVIVFLHGFPSSSWDWDLQVAELVADYRCLRMDFLGFGLSDKPHPHTYRLLEQADLIEAFLKEKGIEDYLIIAHDYGNSVAQELISRSQNSSTDIHKVIYLNGGLFPEAHHPLTVQKLMAKPIIGRLISMMIGKGTLEKSFKRIFGAQTPLSKDDLDITWSLLERSNGRRVMSAILAYIEERRVHRDRWLSAMRGAGVKSLFINGVLDPISGQSMLNRYNELLPEEQTVALEVGHYPQFEASYEVNQILRKFLSNA